MNRPHPIAKTRVAGHAPIGTWRQRNRTDFRAVRNATALELLRKESLDKDGERLVDFLIGMLASEGIFREVAEFFGSGAVFCEMIQEEIVNFVSAQDVFRLLRD